MTSKSTKVLSNTLDALGMSNSHILNWGSTRMAGFTDAYSQASQIIVPFLDTIMTGDIGGKKKICSQSKRSVFAAVFTDLQSIFSKIYLHCVDIDKILICEVHNGAQHTAETLRTQVSRHCLLTHYTTKCENQNVHAQHSS